MVVLYKYNKRCKDQRFLRLVLFWRAMVILHKYNKRCKDQRFLRAMAVQYAEIFHILKTGQKKEEKREEKRWNTHTKQQHH